MGSIIKDIFNDVKTELTAISGISSSNIDLYKNQIESLTAFPSVLIDFPYVYYKDASARIQLGNAMVRVMLCMSTDDLTGADATDIFELKDEVYARLQGVRKINPPSPGDKPKYSPLTRGSERTETKYSGIYVFEMDFYTTIQDDGVYRLKNFVNANDPSVNVNINLSDSDTSNDHIQLDIVKANVRDIVEVGPEDDGKIGLIIDNLGPDKNNEVRTGKIV